MKSKFKQVPGINIQWPWSELIISGKKKIETRSYKIPEKFVGRTLAVIETPGPNGKRAAGIYKARIIGLIKFKSCFKYKSKSQWVADYDLHLVDPTDPNFGFNPTKEKWAWVVESARLLDNPVEPPQKRGIVFATSCEIPITDFSKTTILSKV